MFLQSSKTSSVVKETSVSTVVGHDVKDFNLILKLDGTSDR